MAEQTATYSKIDRFLPPHIAIMRPIHWVKNFSLFAGIVFSGQLRNEPLLELVIWAFIAFNLASSATYVFNDVLDAKSDKLHPIKRFRPVARGAMSVPVALLEAGFLATISLLIANTLSPIFFLLLLGYLAMQVSYSLFLKHIAVIDILVIATGFIIRIYSGAVVINAHLSVWFLLCVISVALFLASGKRRAELGVASNPSETRKSLGRYPVELLNSYVTMFGGAAWLSWALFSFFESPQAATPVWLFLAELSRATTINKLLMLTIPVSIFGIMRYESLIFEGRSEAPEKLLLTDIPLVTSVVVWVMMVVWVYYGGVANFAASH